MIQIGSFSVFALVFIERLPEVLEEDFPVGGVGGGDAGHVLVDLPRSLQRTVSVRRDVIERSDRALSFFMRYLRSL